MYVYGGYDTYAMTRCSSHDDDVDAMRCRYRWFGGATRKVNVLVFMNTHTHTYSLP